MDNKENLPPPVSPLPAQPMLSPSNKPALSRQRDHSSCRRPETPLRVRKTRENLRQSVYADIPPPCLGVHHPGASTEHSGVASLDSTHDMVLSIQDEPVVGPSSTQMAPETPKPKRERSVSRRMLSRVRQGIANRTKSTLNVRPNEPERGLMRRISLRRSHDSEADKSHLTFEPSTESATSGLAEIMDITPRSILDMASRTDNAVPLDTTPHSQIEGRTTSISHSAFASNSSTSPHSTPRLSRKPLSLETLRPPLTLSTQIPCIHLNVMMDCTTIEVSSKRDVWVAIEATVGTKRIESRLEFRGNDAQIDEDRPCNEMVRKGAGDGGSTKPTTTYECGTITSLRLCYKPIADNQIREIIGQKALRNLSIGQTCSLFIRVHVPRLPMKRVTIDSSQDLLFQELKRLTGTLESDVLHVEARYRHSMLPADNVVAIRHVCCVRRPDPTSSWSVTDVEDSLAEVNNIYSRLAAQISMIYPPSQARALLKGFSQKVESSRSISGQENDGHTKQTESCPSRQDNENSNPAVVVTDIDLRNTDELSVRRGISPPNTSPLSLRSARGEPSPSSVYSTSTVTQSVLSDQQHAGAPQATAVLATIRTSEPDIVAPKHRRSEQDTARQVWRQIRSTSLSTKQLEEISSVSVQELEADDTALKALRRTAIANKRSVGAETLRNWRWEEKIAETEAKGELPWL